MRTICDKVVGPEKHNTALQQFFCCKILFPENTPSYSETTEKCLNTSHKRKNHNFIKVNNKSVFSLFLPVASSSNPLGQILTSQLRSTTTTFKKKSQKKLFPCNFFMVILYLFTILYFLFLRTFRPFVTARPYCAHHTTSYQAHALVVNKSWFQYTLHRLTK